VWGRGHEVVPLRFGILQKLCDHNGADGMCPSIFFRGSTNTISAISCDGVCATGF